MLRLKRDNGKSGPTWGSSASQHPDAPAGVTAKRNATWGGLITELIPTRAPSLHMTRPALVCGVVPDEL